MKPHVSILMPVRNAQPYLREALDSILAQTMAEWDLVAVPHQSGDASEEILAAYAARDQRVRIHRFDGDSFVDCLNHGISRCRGGFIARMDADDIMHPARLERQRDLLIAHPEVGIAGSLVTIFGNEVAGGYRRYEEWVNGLVTHEDIAREIFLESPLPHPSVMFRAGTIAQLGGYEEHGWPEDHDLWLRAHAAGVRMAKVPETLLLWRDHGDRASRTIERYSKWNFHRVRAKYLSAALGGRRCVVAGAGQNAKNLSKMLIEHGTVIDAFLDVHPRRVGGEKRGRPVLPWSALADFRTHTLLCVIAKWGVREKIRAEAAALGFAEGKNFFCAS